MDLIINNPARWLIFFLCFLAWTALVDKAATNKESLYEFFVFIIGAIIGAIVVGGSFIQFFIILSNNL